MHGTGIEILQLVFHALSIGLSCIFDEN